MANSLSVFFRKRWRPQFSLRTLAFIVTLCAVYLASWVPTNRAAAEIGRPNRPPVVQAHTNKGLAMLLVPRADAPAPLILSQLEWDPKDSVPPIGIRRRYYLWLFGPMIRLPIALEYTPPEVVPDASTDDIQAVHAANQ